MVRRIRRSFALINSTTGAVVRTTTRKRGRRVLVHSFATGAYYMQAGDDESSDGAIGVPGRRFTWAGGFGAPTLFNVNGNSQSVAIALGLPTEVEPNDDVAHANMLTPDSYVVGNITTPDIRDVYSVNIPTPGTYTIETSGLVGTCGLGIELDTFLSVSSQAGTVVGTNDNFSSTTSRFCSRVQADADGGDLLHHRDRHRRVSGTRTVAIAFRSAADPIQEAGEAHWPSPMDTESQGLRAMEPQPLVSHCSAAVHSSRVFSSSRPADLSTPCATRRTPDHNAASRTPHVLRFRLPLQVLLEPPLHLAPPQLLILRLPDPVPFVGKHHQSARHVHAL